VNWVAIGAIGELIGGAAVIATLIYLAVQLRQNTKGIRAQSYYNVVSGKNVLSPKYQGRFRMAIHGKRPIAVLKLVFYYSE